jgi:carboxylesterase type B
MLRVSTFTGSTLNDHISIPDGISPEKLVNKLIESTTDVFFNLPAVLTADLWGKFSEAFFYQFDHVGSTKRSGKLLLKPLPLVSRGEMKNKVSHGDELGYLFNIRDVHGNKINGTELKSEDDKKTRQNFVDLIINFAYLKPDDTDFRLGTQILKPFRADSSNFIKISNKISFDKDFRFCELSLWGVPLKATQKITCDFPKVITNELSKVSETKNNIMNTINKIG